MKTSNSHFYGVKSIESEAQTKGIAVGDKLWRNDITLTIKFLNDPYNAADSVKAWASEWEKYANIRFEFVDANEDANIRIGFDWNDDKWITWSYTGTDAKSVKDQNKPTLNFAFWNYSNTKTQRGDVLRAFGQVLGLELEHRHLTFDAGWTSRIQSYWEGELSDIPWTELSKYVFEPLNTRNLEQTAGYDESSIMIWPFSPRYATNSAREYNTELSKQDIAFVRTLYPGKEVLFDDDIAFTVKIRSTNTRTDYNAYFEISFDYPIDTNVTIDRGDGTVETIKTFYSSVIFLRKYPPVKSFQEYEVKVYANPSLIKILWINTEPNKILVEDMNLTRLTELKYLDCENLDRYGKDLFTLDLSLNKKLKELSLTGDPGYTLYDSDDQLYYYPNSLNKILLPEDPAIKSIRLSYLRSLYYLDLTNAKNLTFIGLRDVGLISNEKFATELVSNLPYFYSERGRLEISEYKHLNNEPGLSNPTSSFDPEWIKDYAFDRGWSIKFYSR